MPTEGANLSGAYVKQEPYADTTLESPLNGRRRCKDAFLNLESVLISQASGQSKAYVMALLPIICH